MEGVLLITYRADAEYVLSRAGGREMGPTTRPAHAHDRTRSGPIRCHTARDGRQRIGVRTFDGIGPTSHKCTYAILAQEGSR